MMAIIRITLIVAAVVAVFAACIRQPVLRALPYDVPSERTRGHCAATSWR